MSIIREKTSYVIVDGDIFLDSSLSWTAKGILGYLHTRPEGSEITVSHILKRSKEDDETVLDAIKELTEAGYLTAELDELVRETTARKNGVEERPDMNNG